MFQLKHNRIVEQFITPEFTTHGICGIVSLFILLENVKSCNSASLLNWDFPKYC
jgi:hypothetical protein